MNKYVIALFDSGFGRVPKNIKTQGHDAIRGWKNAITRDRMITIQEQITKNILPVHGGEIVNVPADAAIPVLSLTTTEQGADAIRALNKKLMVQLETQNFETNPPGLGASGNIFIRPN